MSTLNLFVFVRRNKDSFYFEYKLLISESDVNKSYNPKQVKKMIDLSMSTASFVITGTSIL